MSRAANGAARRPPTRTASSVHTVTRQADATVPRIRSERRLVRLIHSSPSRISARMAVGAV